MPRFSLVLLALLLGHPALAEDLTVATWGGAYEAAQREAVFAPFAEATGQAVTAVQYDGTVAALRDRAGPEGWDVVDMLADQARAACAEGLLRPVDAARSSGRRRSRISARKAPRAAPSRRMSMPA